MNTKDLQEKLARCQELASVLQTADVRIKSYNEYLEGKNISPREYESTRKQIESAERAKAWINQKISKLSMEIYSAVTPIDEIYNECNDKVKAIEYQGYDNPMYYEQDEQL
jgi:vacuolar-type H+-ATPase subunit I/STV1